jgi:hypothetical protein
MFALASRLRSPARSLTTPESQNEASHARCARACRAALATDDDIDAVLVATIVTQSGAESSESVRDRTTALDAHIFRVLPRDAHKDRSSPRSLTAVASRRSCRSDGTALLSVIEAMKQSRAERQKVGTTFSARGQGPGRSHSQRERVAMTRSGTGPVGDEVLDLVSDGWMTPQRAVKK